MAIWPPAHCTTQHLKGPRHCWIAALALVGAPPITNAVNAKPGASSQPFAVPKGAESCGGHVAAVGIHVAGAAAEHAPGTAKGWREGA